MKEYTYQELKQRFAELGFKWFNFHIIGIRAKIHVPNRFLDRIYIVWGSAIYSYSCTTIPGITYLKKLLNQKGTAVVKADMQYIDAYIYGTHKGTPALEQAKPLTIYRDNDLDDIAECIGEPITAGIECGINIHGTGPSVVSSIIGAWSAGCQVLNNPTEYKEFLSLCKRSGLKNFTYTLLNEF